MSLLARTTRRRGARVSACRAAANYFEVALREVMGAQSSRGRGAMMPVR